MNDFRHMSWRKVLFLFFLSHYLIVSLGAFFFHNHKPDFSFHDNCPACQWQVQSQEDFSQASAILDALDSPLYFIEYCFLSQSVNLPWKQVSFPHFSRAPPFLV